MFYFNTMQHNLFYLLHIYLSNTFTVKKNYNDFYPRFQEHAFESSQKYKEGKFIIELAHMIKENGWD